MRVTQTQVPTMRRMDVTVRRAEAAEGTSLATVSGFYGTAIGAAGGGGPLPGQAPARPAAGGEAPEEETGENNGRRRARRTTPPPAEDHRSRHPNAADEE